MRTFDRVARYAAAMGRRIDIHLVPAGEAGLRARRTPDVEGRESHHGGIVMAG